MRSKSVFALLLAVFFGNFAQAEVLAIPQNPRCVPASARSAWGSITDFESYSRLGGASYSVAGVSMLTMYRSRPHYAERTAERVEAIVQVALRPASLADVTKHPQLVLSCVSWWTAPGQFEQTCRQIHTITANGRTVRAPAYAMNSFEFHMWAAENDSFCPAGETRLSFTARIDMNSDHVREIKAAVADLYIEPLRTLVLRLFNETAFFTAYYENFYQKWRESLR